MTLPWQGTTPEISGEDDSRYETPGGAQNKVDTAYDILLNLLKLSVTGLSNGSEAAIARYSEPYGVTYDWLKDRLDAADTIEINRKEFNVKDFGAIGDFVADDTLAIKAAVAKANIVGGIVYFPPGIYMYSSFIIPGSNTTWRGIKGSSALKMKTGDLPTYGVVNVGSINNFTVRDLSFLGNTVNPTTSPGTAESAFFMLNCNDILIENCYFTGYKGIGIAFQGGKTTKVINCKFENHGQNLIPWRGMSPKSVPAIWAAYNNEGLLVENCIFEDCRWSAVFMLGKNATVKNCRMNNMGETAIYSEYSEVSPTLNQIITGNIISNVYQIDVTACGIELSTSNSIISDNLISQCAGDGIAIGPCSYVTIANNTSFNNNVGDTLGGRGIAVNNKGSITVPTAAKCIKIVGNTCYDDRLTPLQAYGIQMETSLGGVDFINSVISGNSLYRNALSNIDVTGVFDDSSNVLAGNTSG